jgi:hypothetical protein
MTRIRIGYALALIILCCCNPVKKVLDSEEKTNKVVTGWLKTHPLTIDTTYKYLPGDTVTQVIIGYDTTFIPGDTINRRDTVKIKETTVKVRTVRDTVVKTIVDNRLLIAAQQGLQRRDADLVTEKGKAVDARATANKWRLYFFILLAVCVVYVLLKLKLRIP